MLHPTASLKGMPEGRWKWYYTSRLESIADREGLLILSSNICGGDGLPAPYRFPGGSIALSALWTHGVYHGGSVDNNEPGMIVSEDIDLSKIKFWIIGFNPKFYARLYEEIAEDRK